MQKFYWFLSLIFTGLIFYNSSLPASASDEMSYFFVKLVAEINTFLDKPVSLQMMNHIIRKTAHFLEYFIQVLLLCNAFRVTRIESKASHGYILLFSLMTAMFDEYIQLFSPGRSSQVTDIMLDFSGGFTGWLSYQLWKWTE